MGAEVLKLRAVGRGGVQGRRHRRPRQRAVAHRPALEPGVGQPPRVPRRHQVPVCRGVLRRAGRERAMKSSLIVTNHSLLAIDAIEGVPMIPEYDVVVVDEAHELASRVTQAATDELSLPAIERASRRARNFLDGGEADDLADAGDALRAAMDDVEPGRIEVLPESLADRARPGAQRRPHGVLGVPEGVGRGRGRCRPAAGPRHGRRDPQDRRAAGGPRRVRRDLAGRARPAARRQPALRRADPGVGSAAAQAAGRQDGRVHLGDAEARRRLHLGGHLDRAQADRASRPLHRRPGRRVGAGSGRRRRRCRVSRRAVRRRSTPSSGCSRGAGSTSDRRSTTARRRSCTSPARCRRPGRDGLGTGPDRRDRRAARGGRTAARSGLFSSRRAAEAAAEALREAMPHMPILCQGDGQLSHLQAEFIANPAVSLFGTLSLWQGLDVPGRDLPAGDHRPDPVPAARRPVDVGAVAGRRAGRRQRLHGGVGDPCGAAAGAGLGPADPDQARPRRRGDPRPADRHRALRHVPARLAAADVDAPYDPRGRAAPAAAAPRAAPSQAERSG